MKEKKKRRSNRVASDDGLGFCPICGENTLELGNCEVFRGVVHFATYVGNEWEACCLNIGCGAVGEGKTAELAIADLKPNGLMSRPATKD